jgi:hypothetical protein
LQVKTKITARRGGRDLWSDGKTNLSRRFAQRFDALGAQRLLDQPPVFHDGHLLQVRFERAVGGAQGEGTVMTEGGRFAAGIALCHFENPFSYNDADDASFSKARNFTIQRNLIQVKMLK